MGLFSSVLHVRDKSREEVISAVDLILRETGFLHGETIPVPAEGPYAEKDFVSANPCYLVSPLHERWLTLIEAHAFLAEAPRLSDINIRLSKELQCHSLALFVHDDDLFLYNLDCEGMPLDGYNSCPQYFEQKRLTTNRVEEQRHSPEPFQTLLPEGRSLDELQSLLNRGWWNAYNSGNLDEFGVELEDVDFISEEDRMTAFGTLLKLNGINEEYPFAAWGDSKKINWPEFVALRYRKRT